MNLKLAYTFRNYKLSYLPGDILAGIIIMAVSIPISMGYAGIAGLPAVYGLYGSVFPILAFALFSTSRQFIFGVDAAPAALVGATLLTAGIEFGSDRAMKVIPVITCFTAVWLLIFAIFRAGRLVNFISAPVMGGFISGICCTIILMQVPKLYGEAPGTGELFELLAHLWKTIQHVHILSLALGLGTLGVLLVCKRFVPKFPAAIFVMLAGALLTVYGNLDDKGVKLLESVNTGLPKWIIPDIAHVDVTWALSASLPIAIVIMAETLLAENNFALKNGYRLKDNQELIAFAAGNLMAGLTGGIPVNGSVSRTTMSEQYGGKTQGVSVVAGVGMLGVLMFGTFFIGYLPVPMLTAIVISALMGATEFDLAFKLRKVSRRELFIFIGAFFGVLILGTIYGVMIGTLLSFVEMVLRAANPPRCFLGRMPGHKEFFNLDRFKHTYPIEHVIIYRFSSNLFFANVAVFQQDIEDHIKEDTKAVIVDGAGIGSIDVTAAERLHIMYHSLKKRGIRFYLTEHIPAVNHELKELGLVELMEEGAVRRTVATALKDMGLQEPFPIEGTHEEYHNIARKNAESTIQEFVWLFGEEAEDEIEKQIHREIEHLRKTGDLERLLQGSWNQMGSMDEDEWLEHLEAHIAEIVKVSNGEQEFEHLALRLEKRREEIHRRIHMEHPELAKRFMERRELLDSQLKQNHPEIFEKVMVLRENIRKSHERK